MKVMIVVTHLLGTGHLRRASVLARAFAEQGHATTLVSGGGVVPGLDIGEARLVQLPQIRSDGVDFATLLDNGGQPVTAARMASRQTRLLGCLYETGPDLLITELFPFGRRILRAEFIALLRSAGAMERPPLTLCSVRDILAAPSRPDRVDWVREVLNSHYDGVLGHSDPEVIPLDQSWPVTPDIAARLHYTGFVAPPPAGPHPDGTGRGEILVSAGGGPVGTALFDTALRAARGHKRTWRVLVGGAEARARTAALRRDAPSNVIVEPARADFRQMLNHAACSVSLCGYNTAMDLLMAGTPGVLVPFDAGGETEQTLRAAALDRLAGIVTLPSAALDPAALRDAVARAIAAPKRGPSGLRFDGAAQTVRLCQSMLEARG